MSNGSRKQTSLVKRYGPVVIVAIIVGAAIAPVAWSRSSGPDGTVAVIVMDETITGTSSTDLIEELRNARQNGSIKAVVLAVDSPGGLATASEELYMAVRKTSEEMPVVAAVRGIGASGAYYAMLPAETIYVTPASLVGSVGVRGSEPFSGDVPGEITTGPDKRGGFTADEARAQIESMREAFIGSVFQHRGDKLELTREEVSYAKIYAGASAVDNGMADEIGTTSSAIEEAAAKAGLENYDVVRKNPESFGFFFFGASAENGETVVVQREPFDFETVDTFRPLMLYGQVESQEVIGNESR